MGTEVSTTILAGANQAAPPSRTVATQSRQTEAKSTTPVVKGASARCDSRRACFAARRLTWGAMRAPGRNCAHKYSPD
jgi:hypothetical protein